LLWFTLFNKYSYPQFSYVGRLVFRWLPRGFTNTIPTERELNKKESLISLKFFPVETGERGTPIYSKTEMFSE